MVQSIKSDSHSINNPYMQGQIDLELTKLGHGASFANAPSKALGGLYQRDNMVQSLCNVDNSSIFFIFFLLKGFPK